jgi:Kdo2-lipid IVA lauroyltransferase/acyltransferase
MRRRSQWRNWTEYALALSVLQSLRWTPLPLAARLARLYASLLDRAVPRLRRVARANLAFALPGTAPDPIVDGVFRSIARVLLAFARFPSIRRDNVDRWVRCEGMEYYDEAIRAGRGVLFATAHLGNWELSAFAHALFREPMHVVVRPLDNPLLDRLVERRRALSGNHPISKRDSARSILKALAANRAVGILIDQNVTPDAGVFVDFFGVPACAAAGFAKPPSFRASPSGRRPSGATSSASTRLSRSRATPSATRKRYSRRSSPSSASIPTSGFGSIDAGRRVPRAPRRCTNPHPNSGKRRSSMKLDAG